MDVAYDRFAPDVIKIIQDIAESHFVAFDLEFSGIAPSSHQQTPGKPTLQTLYEEGRVAIAKYQILQVGLTTVKEDAENGQYILKPYNFNISPIPTLRERHFQRDFSMSSGAVQFLLRNKFDFGLPFTSGIPYLSRAEEVQARLKLSGEDDRRRPDMILKAEDENLVKHIRQSIAKWQEQPEAHREKYVNIPNDDRGKGVPGVLNRYQTRLTHQVVQNEFPHFKTTSMQQEFVQITNPSQEEREAYKTYQKQQIDNEIARAVGFRWILEAIAGRDISGMPSNYFLTAVDHFRPPPKGLTAMQDFIDRLNEQLRRRRRVFVGHNCFTDLMYLHQFFFGELPEKVTDFQDSIHELFPAIVDTKHIASFGNGRWGDTSLAAVDRELRFEMEPGVMVAHGYDRYASSEKPHEAGYDAMMTARIAIKLSAKMEREQSYIDQEQTPPASEQQSKPDVVPFGLKEEEYVTASEDLNSEVSDLSEAWPETSTQDQQIRSEEPPNLSNTGLELRTGTLAMIKAHDDSDTSSTASPSNSAGGVIAVREKKAQSVKPRRQSATPKTTKLVSAFAATNIYDLLDKDTSDSKVEEETTTTTTTTTTSNSDVDSRPLTNIEDGNMRQKVVDTMVKEGRLMPRWDAGTGFWQIFGNKLQVNSSKEGVCDLTH